jgi:hypothetical protein
MRPTLVILALLGLEIAPTVCASENLHGFSSLEDDDGSPCWVIDRDRPCDDR